jgi:replication factor C subunit 3/5
VIEKFTKNTRFCLICNYISKITPALQSRCTRFRFAPLKTEKVGEMIDNVAQKEGINVTFEGRQAIMRLSRGDMRMCLNIMQVRTKKKKKKRETIHIDFCVLHWWL